MNMKTYIQALRLPFISASALLVIFTGLYIYTFQGMFNWVLFLLALLGISFAHLGSNTINDYFDWNKSDKVNNHTTMFNGGSRKGVENNLSRDIFLKMSIILFSLSVIMFGIILFNNRIYALYYGLIGVMFGALYSLPPFNFQSRGFGELIIFLAFGPFITATTGYILTGLFDINHFLIGIPAGLFVTAIIWINEFPDYVADKKVGKNTLVVRLGLDKSRYFYLIIFILAYLSVVALVLLNILPLLSLISLIGIPIIMGNTKLLWKSYNKPSELVPIQAKTIMLQGLSIILLIISILPFF